MIRQAFVLIVLSLVGAAGTHYFHPRAPSWYLTEEPLRDDEVSMDIIDQRWKGDVFWIDARILAQFEQQHVPGAISLNEQNFDQALFDNIETLQETKKPVVIYCDSEKCDASRKVKEQLVQRMPLEDVFVLKGGWQAWQRAQKTKP